MSNNNVYVIHATANTPAKYRYSLLIEVSHATGTETELFHCAASHLREAVYEAGVHYEGMDYDILTSIRRPLLQAKVG